MCGFLVTNITEISEQEFKKALGLLHHRGPDSEGVVLIKKFKFGHKRLKVLDLDPRSDQPYYSHDKRYMTVFNGEIYNYRQLAAQHSIKQNTTCDTEVVIQLYAKYGPKMLQYLNGMFAFVIYDTLTDDIFIARDRLGIKPLYITESGSKIIISSEVAPIVELTGDNAIDDIALRQYRKLRTFFNGRTIYKNIKIFPAGCYMLNGSVHRYWKLPNDRQHSPDDHQLKDLIESSLKYRCISDVPVGSYLSGGLDSTIIAGLAHKPHTWTVGFEDNNEFEWGRIAAKKFKADHSEVIIDKNEFIELAKFMIDKRKEPLSVPNEVLIYKMTKQVKTKNTVILSGEGADELFFGYDRIFCWAHDNEWDIKEFSRHYSYGSNDDIEIVEDALSPFIEYGPKAIDIVAAFFQIAHLHGLLRRLDNSTMLCSVEARVPFVDHRIIERMAGVPFEYRMKEGIVKHPLKRVFADLVPSEIVERKKVGFPVPLATIDFDTNSGNTHFDKWLDFNISSLDTNMCD